MLPIIGTQVPSWSSAPSVLESYARKPAMISAQRTPTIAAATCGLWCFGCVRPIERGRMPSRPIEKR